jgi:hypothetical protein
MYDGVAIIKAIWEEILGPDVNKLFPAGESSGWYASQELIALMNILMFL